MVVEKALAAELSAKEASRKAISQRTVEVKKKNAGWFYCSFHSHYLTEIFTREKVSLRCCLSLFRISTPVKGVRCLHSQCFDRNLTSARAITDICSHGKHFPHSLTIVRCVRNGY